MFKVLVEFGRDAVFCMILIIIAYRYTKIAKFTKMEVTIKKNTITVILPFIVVLIYIVMSWLYNIKVKDIFPINNLLNFFILKIIFTMPCILLSPNYS